MFKSSIELYALARCLVFKSSIELYALARIIVMHTHAQVACALRSAVPRPSQDGTTEKLIKDLHLKANTGIWSFVPSKSVLQVPYSLDRGGVGWGAWRCWRRMMRNAVKGKNLTVL